MDNHPSGAAFWRPVLEPAGHEMRGYMHFPYGRCVVAAFALALAGGPAPALGQDISYGEPRTPSTIVFSDDGQPPTVLSRSDVTRYRRIFEAQDQGLWEKAEREISDLEDPLLLGHVHYHKLMHPTAHRSSFTELAEWLENYADYPGARRLHRLARRRQPEGMATPPDPINQKYLAGQGETRPVDDSSAIILPLRGIAKEVLALVRDGKPAEAFTLLHNGTSMLDSEAVSQLEGHISTGFFIAGEFARAFLIARDAALENGERYPWIHFRAGLAAWQLGLMRSALNNFSTAAKAETGTEWTRAGGAYWASRVYVLRDEKGEAEKMLRLAADFPRTLYGQLALEILDIPSNFTWQEEVGNTVRNDPTVLKRPETRRAIALTQVGRVHEADLELRYLTARLGSGHAKALLDLATVLRLPAVQIRLGSELAASSHTELGALYPLSNWTLTDVFSVDRALVHAVIRKESGFHIRARSRRGARGLMQVMPATARQMSGDQTLRGTGADQLYDPELNLRMGQRVLETLLELPRIQGNLVYALIAYNAGPTRLNELREKIETDDPLLFIESISYQETRWFVKRVLANMWVYRDQLDQEAPSRSDLTRDEWPGYVPMDPKETPLHAGT